MCILCEVRIEHWLDIYEQLLFLSLCMSHSRKGQSRLSLSIGHRYACRTPLRFVEGEVGGDDSRQLVFIAVGDEVDDGTEHIAVFDDFARLGTKVIYCQDLLVHE